MSIYDCHVCGNKFESDYKSGRFGPKYCTDCKALPNSGMGVVYGLHSGDGRVRYVGSTTDPVHRLSHHRCITKDRHANDELIAWINDIGPENLCMVVLETVERRVLRRREEVYRRKLPNLLNIRSAKPKLLTPKQAHEYLAAYFAEKTRG